MPPGAFERFLEREKKLKRNDLILPIYFVDTPLLNDAELRATDELAEEICVATVRRLAGIAFRTFHQSAGREDAGKTRRANKRCVASRSDP